MLDTSKSMDVIVFWIGNQEYGIPVTAVREIRSWTPITSMPHAPSYMLGVVNLRGSVVPILDLAAKFGYAAANPTPRHAIMIAEAAGEVVGLLVDGVSAIMAVNKDQVQPTPLVATSEPNTFIDGILTIDQRLISLVSLSATLATTSLLAA